MPTGYTCDIAKDISFTEFALGCARGMGALSVMRDEPSDAPIPDSFEASRYHIEKLEELQLELTRLLATTKEEASAEARLSYEAAVVAHLARVQRNDELRLKYETMLAKVKAWKPPSPDHDNFKDFMRSQICSSIDFDCDNSYYLRNKPVELTGDQWRTEKINSIRSDIDYHTKENAAEIERNNGRNTWVKLLRESLKET